MFLMLSTIRVVFSPGEKMDCVRRSVSEKADRVRFHPPGGIGCTMNEEPAFAKATVKTDLVRFHPPGERGVL